MCRYPGTFSVFAILSVVSLWSVGPAAAMSARAIVTQTLEGSPVIEAAARERKARRAVPACHPRNIDRFAFENGSADFAAGEKARLERLIRSAGSDCSWRIKAFAGDQSRGAFGRARISNLVRRRTDRTLKVFDALGVSPDRIVVQEGSNTVDEDFVGNVSVLPINAGVVACDASQLPAGLRTTRLKFDPGSSELTAAHQSRIRELGKAIAANNCAIRLSVTGGANTTGRGTQKFKDAFETARARYFALRDALVRAGANPQQIVADGIDIRLATQGWRGVDAAVLKIGG